MNLPIWLENRVSEFRYALRFLRKTPAVSAIAVLSLAIGIGANTAIFSLVDAVLLKMLPVKSPQELYQVAVNPAELRISWNNPDYEAFRDDSGCFRGLAAGSGLQGLGFQAEGGAEETELVYTSLVSGNYFDVLGVVPALGRLFNPEDNRNPGAAPFAVLSHDFWKSRFGGDQHVIESKIRLNGYPFEIVGVSRRGFRGVDPTSSPDLFIPIMMHTEVSGIPIQRWNSRHFWWLRVIGRLKPGVSPDQAGQQLSAVFQSRQEAERRASSRSGGDERAQAVFLMPAARGYSPIRNRLEKPMLVLMVLVGLVLLIACANIANLLLARGASRRREMAVRLAVGASRRRLTGQLLVESMVIALLGGAAGLMLAWFGAKYLLDFVPQPGWTRISIDVAPDARLFGFTFGVSLAVGLLSGIAPALLSTRPNLVPSLKDDLPGAAAGRSRWSIRSALVVLQVALSLLLVVGSGLFVKSLRNIRDVDLGFARSSVLIVTVDPSRSGYKGQRLRDFYERLLAGTKELPGVRSASLAAIMPLGGWRWNSDIAVEGYQWKPDEEKYVDMNSVGPRFFETMGIPILLGRDFRAEDNPPYSLDPPESFVPSQERAEPPGPRMAIISESMAKHFFSDRNPIGSHVCLQQEYAPDRAYEIIGMVKDAHYFGVRERLGPMLYLPTWRPEADSRSLSIRSSIDTPILIQAIRRLVTTLDPAIPVLYARTMQQQIDEDILEARFVAHLSSFFGLLALLLAGVGLYGVISYSVTGRTREIGIRMALGAQRPAVLRLIFRDAALLVLAGTVIGAVSAVAAARVIGAFLYGISPFDPSTLIIAFVVLAGVATLAVLLPARRASRVDPLQALHYE